MYATYRRVQLYVNTTKKEAVKLAEKIREELIKQGYKVVEKYPTLIIGFGGDGTLLNLLRENNYEIDEMYIGVNCGTLGFLQHFNVKNVEEFVKNIPNYKSQTLRFIGLNFVANHTAYAYSALNEFVIQDAEDKTFRTKVSVEGEFLENYVGSGMIFSTPTGSTALNLSAGGCIVHPQMETIQITPREAIANSKMHCLSKSICIPSEYSVKLHPNSDNEVKIYADGQKVYTGPYNNLFVYYRKVGLTVLMDEKDSFITTIRKKLI